MATQSCPAPSAASLPFIPAEGISGSSGAWVPRAAGASRGQVHPGAARPGSQNWLSGQPSAPRAPPPTCSKPAQDRQRASPRNPGPASRIKLPSTTCFCYNSANAVTTPPVCSAPRETRFPQNPAASDPPSPPHPDGPPPTRPSALKQLGPKDLEDPTAPSPEHLCPPSTDAHTERQKEPSRAPSPRPWPRRGSAGGQWSSFCKFASPEAEPSLPYK